MERELNADVLKAASDAIYVSLPESYGREQQDGIAGEVLLTAMDPKLGRERLVRLGDVLDWLQDADVMIDDITGARLARELEQSLGKET